MSLEILNAKSDPNPSRNIAVYKKHSSSVNAKTKAQQNKFLEAYIGEGTLTHAARLAGIDSKRHYEWLDKDPTYPARFKEAHSQSVDQLEREARRRAIEGTEEPTGWYKGEPGGFVKKYSDALLIFLLKGARPEKYKDRTELSGSVDVNTSPIPLDKLSTCLKRLMVVELTGGSLEEGLVSGIEDFLARYEQERAAVEAGGKVIEADYRISNGEGEREEGLEGLESGRLTYQEGWNVISLF
jgi:hypothetical protein